VCDLQTHLAEIGHDLIRTTLRTDLLRAQCLTPTTRANPPARDASTAVVASLKTTARAGKYAETARGI